MGRRALTAKEKADKLERERERAKKRRSEARPNNQADNIQPNLDDSNNTRLITCSSDPLPETVAEEDIIISSMPLLCLYFRLGSRANSQQIMGTSATILP